MTSLPSVDGYLLESEIGRGGFGAVYRARHAGARSEGGARGAAPAAAVVDALIAAGPVASPPGLARFTVTLDPL